MSTLTGRGGDPISAAVYHRFGGLEVVHIQDVPMPAVGHDDVLI